MAQLNWSTSVRIKGGSTLVVESGPLEAEATERIEVAVPAGVTKNVSLQPGNAASVHLLVLKSDQYKDLSFVVSDGTTDSKKVVFSGAQVYSGGALDLFGVDPKIVKFTNPATSPEAKIEIFVARDATP